MIEPSLCGSRVLNPHSVILRSGDRREAGGVRKNLGGPFSHCNDAEIPFDSAQDRLRSDASRGKPSDVAVAQNDSKWMVVRMTGGRGVT